MNTSAIVNKILTQSFVDGPGNRAVVFLQGCNFACLYCHNPYTINVCNHCGECVDICPENALHLVDGTVRWDGTQCVRCDACLDACPFQASPHAQQMSAREVWDAIQLYQAFLSGVTVSSGEPTLQLEFLVEFFTLVKAESSLTTLIESNGFFQPSRLEPLLPVLDYAIIDLKAWDEDLHRRLTLQPNGYVKDTIRFLAAHGKLHAVQQVVVPSFTDTEDNAAKTARFLTDIDPSIPLQFLRFRAHGTRGSALTWDSPSDELLERLVSTAQREGLEVVSRSM